MVYSPILAVMTAAIEIAGALWTFKSRGRKQVILPIGVILLLLAGYQIAEVFACANPAAVTAARIAFLDILWLPAFGVFLVFSLTNFPRWVKSSISGLFFFSACLLAVGILSEPDFVNVSACKIVFAIFEHKTLIYTLFSAYYHAGFLFILFGSGLGMAASEDAVLRKHLGDIQIGTLCFVMPGMLIEISIPALHGGLSSIMCHFALIFALFLLRVVSRDRKRPSL